MPPYLFRFFSFVFGVVDWLASIGLGLVLLHSVRYPPLYLVSGWGL